MNRASSSIQFDKWLNNLVFPSDDDMILPVGVSLGNSPDENLGLSCNGHEEGFKSMDFLEEFFPSEAGGSITPHDMTQSASVLDCKMDYISNFHHVDVAYHTSLALHQGNSTFGLESAATKKDSIARSCFGEKKKIDWNALYRGATCPSCNFTCTRPSQVNGTKIPTDSDKPVTACHATKAKVEARKRPSPGMEYVAACTEQGKGQNETNEFIVSLMTVVT
jgi:hypothetical protein